MSSRRRKVNSRQRLQKALKEQRDFENELQKLNSSQSPNESAKEIINYVTQSGTDPMLSPAEENSFKAGGQISCSCLIM